MASALKKIQDLVYRGMVLDDKGAWIPIAQKLLKEKAFLRHLEQGEVLVDGVWCKFSDIPKITTDLDETRDVHHPSAPKISEIALMPAPEETVSFSTDTLRDVTLFGKTSDPLPQESDFPPETKTILTEQHHEPEAAPGDRTVISVDNGSDQMVSGETRAYSITGNLSSPPPVRKVDANPKTEYQETFLYNTNMLKKTESNHSTPESRPVRSLSPQHGTPSSPIFHSDEDEHLLKKKSLPFWLIVVLGVGGIAIIAAVWLIL